MNSFLSKIKNEGNKEKILKEFNNYRVDEFVDVDLKTHSSKGKIHSIKMLNGVVKFKIEVISIDRKPSSNYVENISLEQLSKLNDAELRYVKMRYNRSVQMNNVKICNTGPVYHSPKDKVLIPSYEEETCKHFKVCIMI